MFMKSCFFFKMNTTQGLSVKSKLTNTYTGPKTHDRRMAPHLSTRTHPDGWGWAHCSSPGPAMMKQHKWSDCKR